MNQLPTDNPMGGDPSIKISKADLLAAWSILENLAVSLDQIGGVFGDPVDGSLDEKRRLAFLEALKEYFSASLVEKINNARIMLGEYIDEEEAEAISEKINYWDYATSSG